MANVNRFSESKYDDQANIKTGKVLIHYSLISVDLRTIRTMVAVNQEKTCAFL